MNIAEAKEFLKRNWEAGCKCPACGQHVQLYDYKLFATSAYSLILLYRMDKNSDQEYFHIREYAEAQKGKARAPHFAELRFWGLIQRADNDDPAKKSSGYWKITDLGKQFVRGEIKVQSRILVYNNKFQGFSAKSESIDIHQALSNRFDYSELMGIKQEALL
jgi:hypothetical protein